MNIELLRQAEQIGKILIGYQVTDADSLAGVYEEYRQFLIGGGQQPFWQLLLARGMIQQQHIPIIQQQLAQMGPAVASQPGISPNTSFDGSNLIQSHAAPASLMQSHSVSQVSQFAPPYQSAETSTGGLSHSLTDSYERSQTGAPQPNQAQDDRRKIAKYTIVKLLGKGGQGSVYLCDDEYACPVAVKVLNGASVSETSVKRFERERKTMEQLSHPNIVEILDAGTAPEGPYLVMEFIDGKPLSSYIKDKSLSFSQSVQVVINVAKALSAAHKLKVIHRDLKPANIMMSEDLSPKVMDFGLAKELDRETMLTAEGAVVGTPAYMAPEQVNTEMAKVGPYTDQYALGVLLYELLCYKKPFKAPTIQALYRQIVDIVPEPPNAINEEVPENLALVCMKALRKRPEGRYESIDAFVEDLERAYKGEDVLAAQDSLLDKFQDVNIKQYLITRVGLPLLAIVLIIGSWLTYKTISERNQRIASFTEVQNEFATAVKNLKTPGAFIKGEEYLSKAAESQANFQAFRERYPETEELQKLEGLFGQPKFRKIILEEILRQAQNALEQRKFAKVKTFVDSAQSWTGATEVQLSIALSLVQIESNLAADKLVEAEKQLNSLKTIEDHRQKARHGLLTAEVLAANNKFIETAKQLEAVANLDAENARFLRAKAAKYYALAGESETFKKKIRKVHAQGNLVARIAIESIEGLIAIQSYEEAISEAKKALSIFKTNDELRRLLYQVYINNHELAEALKVIDTLIKTIGQQPHFYVDYAEIALRIGYLKEAKANLLKGEELVNSLKVTEGDKEQAKYKKRLRQKIEIVKAMNFIARDEVVKAQQYLTGILKAEPGQKQALLLDIGMTMNMKDRAEKLARFLELYPRERDAQAQYILSLQHSGQLDAAVKAFHKYKPDDKSPIQLLARSVNPALNEITRKTLLLKHAAIVRADIRSNKSIASQAIQLATAYIHDKRSIPNEKFDHEIYLAPLRLRFIEDTFNPEIAAAMGSFNTSMASEIRQSQCVFAYKINKYSVGACFGLGGLDLIQTKKVHEKRLKIINEFLKIAEVEAEGRSAEAQRGLPQAGKITITPFDFYCFQLARFEVLARLGRNEEITQCISLISKYLKRRAWEYEIAWAKAQSNSALASSLERQRALEAKKLHTLSLDGNRATILMNRLINKKGDKQARESKPFRDAVIKLKEIVTEMRKIDERHDKTLKAHWCFYYPGQDEGFSALLLKGALCYDRIKLFERVSEYSNIYASYLAQFDPRSRLSENRIKLNLRDSEVIFGLGNIIYLQSFILEDNENIGKRLVAAANNCLGTDPTAISCYILRAHGYALSGLWGEAESDWRRLYALGFRFWAETGPCVAYHARGEPDKAAHLLRRVAGNRGIQYKKRLYTTHGTLRPLIEKTLRPN